MRSSAVVLPIAFTLGMSIGCGAPPNERPAGDAKPAKAEQPDAGEVIERRIDEAAGGVRRAGERVETRVDEAADALERAGERAHAELDESKIERAETKEAFLTAARQELAELDRALRELEAKGGAAGKQAQADLRAARDQAQRRLDELEKQNGEAWTAAKQNVEQALEKLRADIEARRSS